MNTQKPNGEDMLRDCERDDWDDEPEPDEREKCQCPFCFCSVRTDRGICDMCSEGAHQG